MNENILIITTILFLSTVLQTTLAIQCYQCDSDFDENCRADKPFDTKLNALVDCLSDEAHTPGSYCVKKEWRSPGWWGWHKVTRRCGSSTAIGSRETCIRGFEDQGVYIRECNCNTDGCNTAISTQATLLTFMTSLFISIYFLH